jgi:hypothetical protein
VANIVAIAVTFGLGVFIIPFVSLPIAQMFEERTRTRLELLASGEAEGT